MEKDKTLEASTCSLWLPRVFKQAETFGPAGLLWKPTDHSCFAQKKYQNSSKRSSEETLLANGKLWLLSQKIIKKVKKKRFLFVSQHHIIYLAVSSDGPA